MQSSGGHLLLGHEAGQLGSLEIETYTLRQQGSVKGITWHISRGIVGQYVALSVRRPDNLGGGRGCRYGG